MSDAGALRVLAGPADAVPLLLHELLAVANAAAPPLVCFATGATFAPFLRALAASMAAGELSPRAFRATHLDEYEGFGPARRGGMVRELFDVCPPFAAMAEQGTFVPVPHVADAAAIAVHEARLAGMGGVSLLFAGVGRNGHVAFHEPGVPLERAFHTAELAATTRDDARARFLPDEPPRRAITAGIATILQARRIVCCAFGGNKAAAVRAMFEGPAAPACPASALRRHKNLQVLLDRDAASVRSET